MKKEDRLKILLSTLREKDRYISFQVISEEPIEYSDLESGILNTFLDFYGEFGFSKLSFWLIKNLYEPERQIGVIRCNNKSVQQTVAGLGLISRLGETRITIKIFKISGTIKGLNL